MIGCVGRDASGAAIRAALAAEGIGVAGLTDTDLAATGTALIVVDPDGQNQITVAPGANRALTVAQVEGRGDDFAWAEVVVCQLESPLECVAAALRLGRERGAITILNPAPVPATPLTVLPRVDYLTPNGGEAERLGGAADPARAARTLREAGAGTVIVTLGGDGVLAYGAETLRVPAFTVDVVDTTAAGDAFNAGLAVALAEARPLRAALVFASATAALACTRRGAQASLPSRAPVERLIARLLEDA